jgi:hypothetical protein
LKSEHCGSFGDLAAVLPGKVSISFTLEPNNLPLVFLVHDVIGTKGVVVLAWFPPWALEQFLTAQHIELDTNFRTWKLYVCRVPLAITANESIPMGITMELSESAELYHCFFSGLLALGRASQDIAGKDILSDQHSAIVSICSIGSHFLSLRNLSEGFGLNSYIDQIARRRVFASTEHMVCWSSSEGTCWILER